MSGVCYPIGIAIWFIRIFCSSIYFCVISVGFFEWCANLHFIEYDFKYAHIFILRYLWINTVILALGLEKEKRGFSCSIGMF